MKTLHTRVKEKLKEAGHDFKNPTISHKKHYYTKYGRDEKGELKLYRLEKLQRINETKKLYNEIFDKLLKEGVRE